MAIDTKIESRPESVRGAGQWLRDSMVKAVSEAATQIYNSRNSADTGWQGPASEAFRTKMTIAAKKTEEFSSAIAAASQKIDAYAAELQRAQDDMRAVREQAAAAGLTVNGDVIEPWPWPGSSR